MENEEDYSGMGGSESGSMKPGAPKIPDYREPVKSPKKAPDEVGRTAIYLIIAIIVIVALGYGVGKLLSLHSTGTGTPVSKTTVTSSPGNMISTTTVNVTGTGNSITQTPTYNAQPMPVNSLFVHGSIAYAAFANALDSDYDSDGMLAVNYSQVELISSNGNQGTPLQNYVVLSKYFDNESFALTSITSGFITAFETIAPNGGVNGGYTCSGSSSTPQEPLNMTCSKASGSALDHDALGALTQIPETNPAGFSMSVNSNGQGSVEGQACTIVQGSGSWSMQNGVTESIRMNACISDSYGVPLNGTSTISENTGSTYTYVFHTVSVSTSTTANEVTQLPGPLT